MNNEFFETILENSRIRRFIWEHLQRLNRVIQRVEVVEDTFFEKKITSCQSVTIFLENKLTYQGREPDESKVQKVRDWPPCESVIEVRGFLGIVGVVRVFIKGFAMMARPLYRLTRKNNIFSWGIEEQDSMDALKAAVLKCPTLCAIDYEFDREVVLAVDSSIIEVE